MWGLRSTRTVVIGLAIVIFVVCSALPLAYMAAVAIAGPGGGETVAALWLDARQRNLLANTLWLGVGTALLATAIGAPLGIALARIEVPAKPLVRAALAAPMLLPPYVVALAWVLLGGSAGFMARVTGVDLLSRWTYSTAGAVVVLAVVLYPICMLVTEGAIRRIESRLEEAALLVAPPATVLRRITLPLIAPSVLASALVVFVLAISEFGVPGLLRVRVFTTEIFTAFAALYDFGRATALTVPLLVISSAVAALALAVGGERLVTTRRGAPGAAPLMFENWKSAFVIAAAAVCSLALIVPLATLAFEASRARSLTAISAGSSTAIVRSVVLAGLSATVVAGVGACLGYGRARTTPRLGVAADVLCVVLFAVPSTIVGVGLIGVWNRPGMAGAVYGTDAMLLLAAMARFLPLAALTIAATVRQVPVSHEEAALVSGARWLRTMTRIVVPQSTGGLMATWVVVFVLTFGELGASLLVAPPGDTTLPIRIYTLIANSPPSEVAALALLQSTVVLVPLALMAWRFKARIAR